MQAESKQNVSPHRQQLLANIDNIIEYLSRVPGVIKVDIEEATDHDTFEKRVHLFFAGCAEPVAMELY